MNGETVAVSVEDVDENKLSENKSITHLVYALQAASFLIGITLIVAVIVNYLKMREVRGSWLESHFRWQLRTFWYSLLWTGLALLVLLALFLSTQNLILLFGVSFVFLIVAVWVIYRIARGWLALSSEKAMYID